MAWKKYYRAIRRIAWKKYNRAIRRIAWMKNKVQKRCIITPMSCYHSYIKRIEETIAEVRKKKAELKERKTKDEGHHVMTPVINEDVSEDISEYYPSYATCNTTTKQNIFRT